MEIGKKFSGRISNVKIWANSTSISDVHTLKANRNHNPDGFTIVHGWYNYKMTKGAVKKSPSQADNDICDVPACLGSGTRVVNKFNFKLKLEFN